MGISGIGSERSLNMKWQTVNMLTRPRVWNWVFLIRKSTIYHKATQKKKKKGKLTSNQLTKGKLKYQESINILTGEFYLQLAEGKWGFIKMFNTDTWLIALSWPIQQREMLEQTMLHEHGGFPSSPREWRQKHRSGSSSKHINWKIWPTA